MRLPRIWGTHSHYYTNMVGPGDNPAVPSETGVKSIIKNFINNQGSNLVQGDVVKYDETGDNFVKKPNANNDLDVMGVVIGPLTYANGAAVPVLLQGYHPGVKVTGSVSRGDYLYASTTSGVAKADNLASAGAFARVVQDDASGLAPALIFDMVLGTGAGGGATQLITTTGPTTLDITTIPDFTYLQRSGTNVLGKRIEGMGKQYDPRLAPASPSTKDDEFDAGSLNARWATGSSGAGSSGAVNVTDRVGFLHTNVNDGGAGSARWVDQACSPAIAAGEYTMMARVFGNVGGAGSNQMNIELSGGGTTRFVVGMLNGTQAIINGPAGFTAHNRTYITGNFGEIWLMIQHDAGTGMDGWVSGDGMIWSRLTGMTSAGTVDNIRLVAVAFSSSNAEGWWDFFRYFPGVRVFTIGGNP